MRFVSFKLGEVESYGVLTDDKEKIVDIRQAQFQMKREVNLPDTLLGCIEMGNTFINEVSKVMNWTKEQLENNFIYDCSDEKINVLAPIQKPRKNIFCVGKNYAAHAIEMGSEKDIPDAPIIFSKAPTTVIGTEQAIQRHADVTDELDYEGEIAVIIGKKGKAIKKEEAYDYLFGYTLINDVTARDLQRRHKQFLLGKSMDSSCPMGPWITHRSLVEDGANLHIETKVNGELRQQGNTAQFIFDIPTIISTISQGTTLEPGDIIATGTPAGVGSGFTPPKFLNEGDSVEIKVDELGVLRNVIK
ncbi:fumarylacetoacetate hydrolase family protein [Bacillus sp. FJAT-45350]|uniref:fumarylacetoacetate hydrolase family protein n=1 Tax=Bacillus sp. FJAT-45350 TaxID=2011014 RepID=UPI000BB6ED81|nr:fumarylacetoacetate hydrolase family protein [Bacillus sp. FJAT-45350]